MSVQINYKNSNLQTISGNLILFVDENFKISGLKKYISNNEYTYISDLLKNSDLKKNLLFFEINSKKTIFLASIKKDFKSSDVESLGAKFHSHLNFDKKSEYYVNSDTVKSKITNLSSICQPTVWSSILHLNFLPISSTVYSFPSFKCLIDIISSYLFDLKKFLSRADDSLAISPCITFGL